MTYKFTYARELLAETGVYIYSGRKNILKHKFSDRRYHKLNRTGFWVKGERDIERNILKLDTMGQLNDIGFGVVSVIPEYKVSKHQQVQYVVARLGDERLDYLRNMPSNHKVEYDVGNKQVRIIGPNAGPNRVGRWIHMVKKSPRGEAKYNTLIEKLEHKDKILKSFRHSMFGTQREEFQTIPELPFMITESSEIVCFPKQSASTRDEPRIGVWGIPGSGKSWLMHNIADRGYWKEGWGIHVVILNDRQRETGSWAAPNDVMESELSMLNEAPRPLPAVYLHPTTEDTGMVIHENEGIGYKISLPYSEVILNFHKYFDMGGSAKWFSQKRDEFIELLKSNQDLTVDMVMEVFGENEPRKVGDQLNTERPPDESIKFVKATLNEVKERNILDVWNGVPSKWLIQNGDEPIGYYNPISACVLAGLVPVLVTENLLQKGYFPQYFQYFANDLFNRHVTDPNFKKIRTWVMIDEILSITRRGKTTAASEALERLQTEGRQRRIGTLIATQNYSKVHDRIRTNCNYIICFGTPEAGLIQRDYSLGKLDGQRMKKLGKFECMAYTYDHFIVYDIDGTMSKQKGPLFGKALPPLSMHESPSG